MGRVHACMCGRSGYPVERLRKYQHTDFPSIRQGPRTPWTHQHPVVNTVTLPAVSSSGAFSPLQERENYLQRLQKLRERLSCLNCVSS
ncbi:uncharacterized protein LOC143031997 isoform X1 [Oratosquilla oratoria]|uniref:uncharacterized protein LOC143031997 isoform X1 n=1 Tax=Oratosquilla oratoria TaxID=337810 RepID=UPI003F763927